jgi:hypothetical protein
VKYNTIPIPQFPFTDVPEHEAEELSDTYFQSVYNIGYYIDTAKNDIRNKVIMQDSRADKIVILSYLINKLTERILTLPVPQSDMERGVRQRETIPTYTALLHFLYRLIEQEDIKIPTDLFDEETYKSSQILLLSIHESLEEIKLSNPDKTEAVTAVQEEIKKSSKFLWLGKEDWAKILIGAVVTTSIKEGIAPLLPTIFLLCQNFFINLIPQ